jgi:hypothetical protein
MGLWSEFLLKSWVFIDSAEIIDADNLVWELRIRG